MDLTSSINITPEAHTQVGNIKVQEIKIDVNEGQECKYIGINVLGKHFTQNVKKVNTVAFFVLKKWKRTEEVKIKT